MHKPDILERMGLRVWDRCMSRKRRSKLLLVMSRARTNLLGEVGSHIQLQPGWIHQDNAVLSFVVDCTIFINIIYLRRNTKQPKHKCTLKYTSKLLLIGE